MSEPIIFYPEFASPYAYIAAQGIEAVGERHQREVVWKPISIAHVWKAIDYVRSGVPKQRFAYIMQDAGRCAKLAGIPFTKPTPFPVDAKLARLVFYRLNARDPGLAKRFALAVFNQYWGEGRDIQTPEDLAGLADNLRFNRDELSAALEDADAKKCVIDATNEAIGHGCFGAPWFHVEGENFWGADRIDHISTWLRMKEEGAL